MRLLVTYMELREPPAGRPALPVPAAHLTVQPERLSVEDYLLLYREIGTPLTWDSRLHMPQAALVAFLSASSTTTFVPREAGRAIGLCEFDAADTEDTELTHFGLIPAAYGRRIGPWLLDTALRAVWREATRRIWLHTDTNDHPKAQATYRRAGFEIYKEQMEDFPD
ncbi:GNAT family N-acetyltransferase [Shinella sp. WSJ-2]|uniref:GNAT family N-acetyltransferase n=1 Tax=Shinella sp. WSJ-2 TaxID=2303749 RepID=UPI000E3C52A3|nr:GNAT family N-acetyltransferase [Shinella sp. WSJ-2]RFZ89031.1 GNAT family N-acetyltransferase [Shinella sp. WSJ-2]